MIDIIDRLQDAMHEESAIHSPRTTKAIETMRAAKEEIECLRIDLESAFVDGHDIAKSNYQDDLMEIEAKLFRARTYQFIGGIGVFILLAIILFVK